MERVIGVLVVLLFAYTVTTVWMASGLRVVSAAVGASACFLCGSVVRLPVLSLVLALAFWALAAMLVFAALGRGKHRASPEVGETDHVVTGGARSVTELISPEGKEGQRIPYVG